MTTIYFVRHSEVEKTNNIINTDNLQMQNEKQILSVEGEKLANTSLNVAELKDINILISSNYVRAISTAKYIANNNNNIAINIMESFGERKFGINSWAEIPADFYERQYLEPNYKIGNGESQREVRKRMLKALEYVLATYKNKKIAIVTHSTALFFLMMNWCEIDKETGIFYKDKFVAPSKIECCAIFKFIFDDDNNLVEIKKI
jgi:2,3-bisphosphoglycerate-dependent phosphoglycerate mutase